MRCVVSFGENAGSVGIPTGRLPLRFSLLMREKANYLGHFDWVRIQVIIQMASGTRLHANR